MVYRCRLLTVQVWQLVACAEYIVYHSTNVQQLRKLSLGGTFELDHAFKSPFKASTFLVYSNIEGL